MQNAVGPAMWTFGSSSGVNVWSADGQDLLKTHPPSDLPMCGPSEDDTAAGGGDVCSFFAFQSDGHQYVWAGAFSPDRVDVFDIDTAEYVSYIPTCSTPLDLDYVPNRQEMWLHCAGTNEGSDGHIDVFSTNSLGTNFDLVNLNVTGRSYGHQVTHSSLGLYGYATVYNQPFLYKIDLATRQVNKRVPLELSSGAYDMAYSPLNHHIFVRSRVTCTCGDETKDIDDCGRFGSGLVDIETGPSAGQKQVTGTSGSSCEGSAADTIGVYEYDTKTDRIVGSHNILKGTGQGATPVTSPKGDYVLLLGNDGGQNVRVLRPQLNAAESVSATSGSRSMHFQMALLSLTSVSSPLHFILQLLLADIPVNFNGGLPGQKVITDVAFVEVKGTTILVIASGTDNEVAVVNMNNPTNVAKVQLTSSTESTGGGDDGRSVEWAEGTEFVWITGPEANEIYVVQIPGGDIEAARVVQTIQGVDATAVLYVENYASKMSSEQKASLASIGNKTQATRAFSIAAIVLSCAALLSVVFLFVTRGSVNHSSTKVSKKETVRDDPETALDMKSLGSKQVN